MKIGPFGPKKSKNNSKIRLELKVRIKGNIKNKYCYGIREHYDDDNEEEKEE